MPSDTSTSTGGSGDKRAPGGGGVDVSSVTTEAQLIALIQEAYGDAGLGLHRGHQPVEDVLNEVRGLARGGAFGSIMGRNAFQRPHDEAVKLLHDVMEIFRNPGTEA